MASGLDEDRAGPAGLLARVPGEATAYVELPALPQTPSWARRHARAVLGAWEVPEQAVETVILVVSELVTNSVAATMRDVRRAEELWSARALGEWSALPITQVLRRQPGHLVIEVSDADPDPPVLADAGPEAESGRGLMLVQALSKEWSCAHRLGGGKTVCCLIAVES